MTEINTAQIKYPSQKIKAKLLIEGLFSLPEQWKTTDQGNPGLFTYIVRMSKFQIAKGKIQPRQLTDRQKRQNEQKNKKGGKKDSKNPQPNEQQQRLKKQQQQRQRLRQEQFESLSEEERVFHAAEDVYKSAILKFDPSECQYTFIGKDCLIIEERILKDKGDWLYIYKVPAVSQDELAKMRKSKPKTLANINDLNPIVMRAWVDFQNLSKSKEQKQIKNLRCKVQQVQKTPQTSEPNLSNTYIKLSFSLDEPIQKQKDQFSTSSLIKDAPEVQQLAPEIKCVNQLKDQLNLAIESLAMQYSAMFWKEINMQEEQRNLSIFLNNKKGQSTKRKQQFLYDFNISGKYKVLKDRIKKCIVHLCETKYKDLFVGMKSFNGVKCNSQDQIYSQIYDLLVSSYQSTSLQMYKQKQQQLNEVLVTNQQVKKNQTEKLLNSHRNQTINQRVKRIIRQYQLVQNYSYGQKVLKKHIEYYPQSVQLKYEYGIYCLKYNLKPTSELLPIINEYLTKQKNNLSESNKLQYMIILLNSGQQNLEKGWIILRDLIETALQTNDQQVAKWMLLAYVVLKQMKKNDLAEKYKSSAERHLAKIRKQKSIKAQGQGQGDQGQQQQPKLNNPSHKQMPNPSQIPSLIGVSSYQSQQLESQINNIYNSLVQLLGKNAAFDLIDKIIAIKNRQTGNKVNQNITQQQAAKQSQKLEQEGQTQTLPNFQMAVPKLMKLLVLPGESAAQQVYELSKRLYESSLKQKQTPKQHRTQYLQFFIKSQLVCVNYKSKQQKKQLLIQLQGNLKKSLSLTPTEYNKFITLFRLGYVYYLKEQYGNARACLLKYLEKVKVQFSDYSSGLAYKILGISNIRINMIQDSIQCFKHWNLCDSKNQQVWLYLALSYSQLANFISVNQCLNQYCFGSSPQEATVIQQIKDELQKIDLKDESPKSHYSNEVKTKILESLA